MNSSVNTSCEVPIIEAKNLYMEYGSNVILEKINVKIHKGEFITVTRGTEGCKRHPVIRRQCRSRTSASVKRRRTPSHEGDG